MDDQPLSQMQTQTQTTQDPRVRGPARLPDDREALGPLSLLAGSSWEGHGWNMIALPFEHATPQSPKYRLLVNRYEETLDFKLIDRNVPNRGIAIGANIGDPDQMLVALDYEQEIKQLASEDSPHATVPNFNDHVIHHEPGLWLHMRDERTNGIDIARLATIPHGDSVLALGRSRVIEAPPGKRVDVNALIPRYSGLPIGVNRDLADPYLAPYEDFNDKHRKGDFPSPFNPVDPCALLLVANENVNITKLTVLGVDTRGSSGGIVNTPFVIRQANAAEMTSTFWIQEGTDENDEPLLRLQYCQVVLLDFFPRQDGVPGLIRWPHVSINTLTLKTGSVAPPDQSSAS